MGSGINQDSIADLVASVTKDLGRLKVTDLMSSLQDHVFMNKILTAKKTQFKGTTGIQFNVAIAHNNSARHVGLYSTDAVNVGDGLKQGSIGWRHTTSDWAIDRREISMNQADAEQVVDLIKERRLQGLTSLAEKMEETGWSKPADSTDDKTPYGIPYWIVKNATEGFNGGNPSGFTSGCAGLSSSTYARWANWTAQYTNVSKDDLIRKMRKASRKTNFRAPVKGRVDYSSGDDMAYYTNDNVVGTMEELLEDQNDNLGKDMASMDGQVMFRRRPVVLVPYLDNDATDPVYGINWGVFKIVFLKGEFMREEGPEKVANQHTVLVTHNDTSWNTVCYDRRRQFVISK